MRRLTCALACALALLPPDAARGQIGDDLAGLAEENAELWLAPVFEGFGHAMGTGFLRTPDVHGTLGFDVGLRVMVALIPDDKKTFAPVLPSTITVTLGANQRTFTDPYAVQGGGEVATAVGDPGSSLLVPTGDFADSLAAYGIPASDYDVTIEGGFDIPAIPFGTVQLGLGVGLGTEVSLRLTPSRDLGDAGSIGGGGFGVAHSLNQWLIGVPVDLAVFLGYQRFNVGDYFEASTTAFGGAVGKGLGPLSAYLVGQYAKPSVDVEYTVSNPDDNPALPADGETITFSPDLGGGVRTGVGAQLNLLVVQFAAEYTVGSYNALTARASFGIR